MPVVRRRSRCGAATATTTLSAVSAASGTTPVPQSTAAAGSAAPRRATSTIHATHQAARVPSSRPSPGETSPSRPPPSPSTVAGPTAGATTRLAATATRLTWPERAATRGVHASWAAAGTATASASHRGSHRASASRQPGASSRMPAVARTDSAKPIEVASAGSTSSRHTTATPSARVPRCRPCTPIASSPTDPIAAARTTLGSVRASSTNPAMPNAPTAYSQRPRTPTQRASSMQEPHHQREVGAGDREQVRQAGGPEVVREVGVDRRVVPVDQGRDQRALVRGAVLDRAAQRGADGVGPPPPGVGPGQRVGRPPGPEHGGQVRPVGGREPSRGPHGRPQRHPPPARVRR